MTVSYDLFVNAFLNKVTEYTFVKMDFNDRMDVIDGYMKRACAQFASICKHDIVGGDDERRVFELEINENELDELIDIISEGMVVQWMKPYMYKQENLENMLNTSDFSAYSPAELLYRITNAYNMCKKDFTVMMREYSYNHGDLSDLHL